MPLGLILILMAYNSLSAAQAVKKFADMDQYSQYSVYILSTWGLHNVYPSIIYILPTLCLRIAYNV